MIKTPIVIDIVCHYIVCEVVGNLRNESLTQLGLSQQAFADLIKTPVATLRDWEQGRCPPPGAVLCLLQITLKHPDVLLELAA